MRLVVDANVVISGLITESTTRRLLLTVEAELLTPEVIHDEVERHVPDLADRSGLDPDRVRRIVGLLFRGIEVVPTEELASHLDRAERAIGGTDPDDVLYLACALACGAAVWSDDAHFEEQDLVRVYKTADVVDAFGRG